MTQTQITTRIQEILSSETSIETQEKMINFVLSIRDEAYDACKAIFAHEIRNEIFKTRTPDHDKNLEIINIIGGCYTCIEIEVQKNITRSIQGEHLNSIYPKS